MCPNDIHLLLLPYGTKWRKQRKILQSLLNVNVVDKLLPLQEAEARQTMLQLVHDPCGYYNHIRRYTTAVILASVYGQRGPSFDCPNVQALYHAQDQFTAILEQGASPIVDAFPFLKWVPEFLAPWKTRAKSVREEQNSLYLRLLRETKKRIEVGGGGDCFLRTMLEDQRENNMNDEEVAYLAGNLVSGYLQPFIVEFTAFFVLTNVGQMEAGSDTTASTLLSFLLAMIRYPEEFRKAQNEVDAVCGSSRSPTSDDFCRLPFIKACMYEVFHIRFSSIVLSIPCPLPSNRTSQTLRWRPVAPGGVPHALTRDDTYDGFFLPKGTVVIANTWAIHNDETHYERPDDFMPDRFSNNESGTRVLVEEPTESRQTTYAFGAGRRACPGHRLAKNSLVSSVTFIYLL